MARRTTPRSAGVSGAPLFQPGIDCVAQGLQLSRRRFVAGDPWNIGVEGGSSGVRSLVVQRRDDVDQLVENGGEAGDAFLKYGRTGDRIRHRAVLSHPAESSR